MRAIGLIALSLLVTACGGGSNGPEADDGVGTIAAPNGAAPAEVDGEAATADFSIEQVAISNVPLGEFPYFSLPEGYTNERRGSFTKDFARFPFWVKGAPVWVEGKFYGSGFVPVKDKEMSEFEVAKNFESVIAQLGGVKLSEEKIPSDIVRGWGDEITSGFLDGLGDVYNAPATTYVIRRADGNVWVHLVTNNAQGWYIVGREEGFGQSASLLPAAELKEAIDRDGKAIVQVNFATDESNILPDSRPQIDAIMTVLKGDPKLRLAINGHTDDTGDAAHNRSLSERRAASVRQALLDAGIAGDRLTARGFGSSVPIAGNDSDEGKARNRRVELVRL